MPELEEPTKRIHPVILARARELRRKMTPAEQKLQTYNDSQNCQSVGITYSERSLSSKRFEIVFSGIVALIEQSQ